MTASGPKQASVVSYAEVKPETVALAKELRGQRMSLRKISAELAARGQVQQG